MRYNGSKNDVLPTNSENSSNSSSQLQEMVTPSSVPKGILWMKSEFQKTYTEVDEILASD